MEIKGYLRRRTFLIEPPKILFYHWKMTALIFFLLFFSASAGAQDYWQRQLSPSFANLNQIVFTDSLNGWSAGDSGVIIHTSNGGLNWARQNSGINYEIYALQFINVRLGWGIANDFISLPFSTILKTTNGGMNWTLSFYPDSNVRLIAIYFLDSLNGWAGGSGPFVYQSTDGGTSWMTRYRDTSYFSGFPIRCFAFWNPVLGLAGGGVFDYGGIIWRTTNAGLLWKGNLVGPEPIFELKFLDSLKVLGTGGDLEYGPSIVRSTDSGISWEYIALGFFGVGRALAVRNGAEVWIPLSFSGTFAVSFDSMKTWDTYPSPHDSAINDAVFIDSAHGWACGENGMVARYNPRPIGIANQSSNVPWKTLLYQNYPNPFNQFTIINYQLSVVSDVVIRIYDMLGRELRTIRDGTRMPGSYRLNVSGIDLPSGVYYYRLETHDFFQTRKMVIVK